jgi:hypothetical protein
MPRPITLYGIAILSVLIVLGGFVGWVLMNAGPSTPSDQSPTAKPSQTPTPIIVPSGYVQVTSSPDELEATPAPGNVTIEQVRDSTMSFILTTHGETAELMTSVVWTGGQQSTGLNGAESYVYISGNWVMTIEYPVVPDPTYNITANYTTFVYWSGTFQDGNIQETSYFFDYIAFQLAGSGQARDAAVTYMTVNHPQTVPFFVDANWANGTNDGGFTGILTCDYFFGGWDITVQSSLVSNPAYDISATYFASGGSVSWTGTYKDRAMVETSYSAVFPTPTPSPTPTPKPTATPSPTPTPTKTPSPSPTAISTPTPTPTFPTAEQIRTATMNYIRANHTQMVPYMPTQPWIGGQVGTSNTYAYTNGGWSATLVYSAVPIQSYTITVNYNVAGQHPNMVWRGIFQRGVLTETSYIFNP